MNALLKVIKVFGFFIIVVIGLFFIVSLLFTFLYKIRETKDRHEIAPLSGKFVNANNEELYIEDLGPKDGQTLILIGGTGAWSGFWHETAASLSAAGYRIVAIDMPPFGFSEIPLNKNYGNINQSRRIISIMDNLGINSAVLVGHSFGGGATIETALTIPNRIDGLILADVGGLNFGKDGSQKTEPNFFMKLFLNTKFIRNPIIATTATNPMLTRKLLSLMVYNPKVVTKEKIDTLRMPMSLRHTTNTMADWLKYVLTESESSLTTNPDNYKVLTMPTLIIWGDSDRVIPIKEGEYLNNIIHGSELVTMKGVNHIPYIEDNPKFIEIIATYLGKHLKTKSR